MKNTAERLLDIADAIQHPRDEVLAVEDVPQYFIGMVALAMRLRRHPGVAVRAMVEDWDRSCIIRELY